MPDFKVEIRARLAELQLSPVREAEIVEELSQHLEQEYERALSCGASDDEARRQVLEQLNASDLLGRELKHVEHRISDKPTALGSERKINIFADLLQDLRYGLRMLAKNPAFTSDCCSCPRIGHRCKQRNFQCGRRRTFAAPPVQEP